MKMKYTMCVLAVALMGEARGQQGLVCNNCEFVPVGGTSSIIGTSRNPATILSGPGEFSGDIKLNGYCGFTVKGTGDYQLSGSITGTGSLNIYAYQAGTSGLEAGITFSGARANSYTDRTTIYSGYLTCFKNDGVRAVPEDVYLTPIGIPAHLWCRTNNQLNSNFGVWLGALQGDSYFHLNGTTQSIGGLGGSSWPNHYGLVENNGRDTYFPAGMTGAQMSTNPATLNIITRGNAGFTEFTCGLIRNGIANSPALTINLTGYQTIKNFGKNVHDVTFSTEPGAVLSFEGTSLSNETLGANVTFKGSGNFYFSQYITTNNSTFLASGLFFLSGPFRNGGVNNYTLGTETNKATLNINTSGSFDLYGNNVIIDGLTGIGRVFNNFASTSGPDGGYSRLVLGQNDSQNSPVFYGEISDNLSGSTVNVPVVPNGGFGQGGVAIRKVGSGRQVFGGNNTYTGPTEVASGTLILQYGGILGGGVYTGKLDIANVAAGNPAVFEHNGVLKQVFEGDITSSGSGSIPGSFIQSGNGGMSILKGSKTFSGNVNITDGYLGGDFDLSHAASVKVGANGKIGGGEQGSNNLGGTITVSGLSFETAETTLEVRTMTATDGRPSVVNVVEKGTSNPGPISAPNGFKIDLYNTDNQKGGYIIKCSNGVGLPLPVLRGHNTRKEICFVWDNIGLYMRVNKDISLLVSSICPKGVNSGNAPITITATYSDPRDYLAPGATGTFTVSVPSVISGSLVHLRLNESTVTGTFDGVNTTAPIAYKVTYDDGLHCIQKVDTRLNLLPTLSKNSSGVICKGTEVILQAAGNRPTISCTDVSRARVVENFSPNLSATVTPLVVGTVKFLATDRDGCKSDYLEILVRDTPVIDPQRIGFAGQFTFCAGEEAAPVSFVSTGTGDRHADAYTWQQEAHQSEYDIGLVDYTAHPPTKTAIDGFIVRNQNIYLATLFRPVIVKPYNAGSGCYGEPFSFRIVVYSNRLPTINPSSKICANTGGKTSNQIELRAVGGFPSIADWSIISNRNFAKLVDQDPNDDKVLVEAIDNGQDDEKAVIVRFGNRSIFNGPDNCSTTTTVSISPRTKLEYMKATNLCEYNGGINGSVTLEVKYSGRPNFTSGSPIGHWIFSNPAISANPAEPAALATSATEAKGTFQGVVGTSEVRYIDNTTGCAANEYLTAINIEAMPAPAVTAPLEVCQNAPAPTLTVNEAGTFKWWGTGSGPDANVPIPSTATAGSTDYKVSKEKTYNAQPSAVVGSATAAGYTCLSRQATLRVTVNSPPVISFTNGAATMKLCPGALYNDAISLNGASGGTWAVYQSNTTNTSTIFTGVANSTTANHANIQAGNATASVTEDIFFTSNFSCKSNGLTITTYPKPVMEAVVNGNLKIVCKGDNVAPVSFVSTGTGEAHADAYTWQQEGTNNYDIGLADYTAQPPTKTATDRFTALNTTTSTQRRDLKVKPYNNNSGCSGASIDFSIEVRPDIAPAITPLNAKICANAGGDTHNHIDLTASENATTAASWVITANGNFAKLVDQNTSDNTVSLEAIDTGQDDEKAVTVLFTGVSGCTTNTGTTIIVSPRTKLEYMKATNLCEYNGGINRSVELEVKYSGQHNFVSGSTITGHWKFSNPAISANPVNPAEPAALATSATEAKGTFQGVAGTSEVRYIDNTTGCTANEYLTTINIEAIPAPVVTSPLEVCQNAPAPILTVNEAGTFKWWSTGSGPDANAPIPSTTTAGSTDYKVSKEKTYNAQPTGVTGSATAAGYTCLSPQATIRVTVNAVPVISFANVAATMKLCSGALYNDAISLNGASGGTWAVYQSNTTNASTIFTGVANSTTANHANIQAGNATASVTEDIFFTSNFTCKSNGLTITTYPKPVMEAVVTGNLKIVCKGDNVAPVSFVSTGTGEAHADAYTWQQEGTNNYDIGLADYTAQPPTKTATDRFTALNTTTSTQRRDLKVKPYNNNSGCSGASIDFSIEVRPDIAPVITPLNAKICANAGGTTLNHIDLTASENATTAASWVITSNGNFAKLVDQNTSDNTVMLEAIDTGQDDEKAVTVLFTGVSGCTTNTGTTIIVSPRTKLEYMKATNLCEYNGGVNGSVVLEVKYSGQHNFTSGSTTGHWKFSNAAISANPINPAEPTALATSATEAKGAFQGVAGTSEVRYIDNTTGCTANEYLTTINIEAIPAPVVTSPLEVCQNAPAPTLTVNEAGPFKWWSTGSVPEANAPIPSTATAGSTDYRVSKEKTYNAQPTGATGSATAAGYTCLSPQAIIRVTVNAGPVISFANNATTMKLCAGATYNDAISLSGAAGGTWAVYQSNTTNAGTISTGVTNSTTANRANIQAGNATAAATEDIFFTSNFSCKSNALTITTYPKPVMEAVVNGNLKTVCKGDDVAPVSFISTGTGEAHADAYVWQQEGTNNYDIGLADYTAQQPTKTATDRFTALNTTTATQRRDLKVKPYNNNSACYGVPIDFSIEVRPDIAPVITPLNAKICANAGGTTLNHIDLTASENATTAASWVITANGNFAKLVDQNTSDNTVMLEAIDTGQDDEKAVTILFTGVSGCTTTAGTTIIVSPRTKLEYMKATNLCEYNGGVNGSVVLEVKYSGQHNFTSGSTTGHWKFSNAAISANPVNPAEPAALATSATEAKGTFQGVAGTSEVRYIDNTTGCTANEYLTTINIEAIPAPVVTSPLEVCQNAPAPILTVNEAGPFKWWSTGSVPDANAPIPSTATAGSTDYRVSKEKTYNAQPTGATGSATAAGYTCLSPQAIIRVTVNAGPVISFANNATTMKLCAGATYNDAISLSGAAGGTWAVYQSNTTNAGTISTGVTNSTTANRANIQAGNATAAATEDIFFTSNFSCKSNALTITTYPKPVMEAVVNGNLKTVCKGDDVAPVSFISTGTGEAHADAYVWQQEGTNNYDIGLADYTAQQPTKTATDRFTALNTTTATQRRDLKVKPYNNNSACYGVPIDFSIEVRPDIAPVITPLNAKICANAGGTTLNHIDLTASENATTAASWVITSNGNFAKLVDQNTSDNTVMLEAIDTGQDDEKAVTILFTGVSGCTTTAGTTIIVSPRTKLEYMKATNLCEYNGGVNGSVVLEVKYSGQHNFTSGSTTGHWKFSNAAISANPVNPAEPAALATSATEAKGTFQGVAGTSEVRYIDNTTGCTANEYLTTINIEAIPAPVVTSPLEVCQNAPAPILTVNEAGPFKWWSTGSVPDANAPIPSTATAGSTDYRVSKEKTYNAQPTGATGSATAAGYTCLSPQAIIRVTVNAGPVISFANNATTMKLCAGATYNDAISLSGAAGGTWAVYQSNTTNAGTISTGVTNSTTANRANIQAGNATAAATEDIFFTSNFSCKSNALTITTYPKPVMEAVVNGNLKTVCKGDDVAPVSFISTGTGEAHADAYVWQQEGTNNYDIGLADYTAQQPTKTATDRFTALNTTTATQRRDLKVKPYNNNSACYGVPIDFSIEVRPDIAPVITPLNAKICANAGGTTLNHIDLTASENATTAASWVITSNGNFAKLVDQNTSDNTVMLEAIDTGQDDEKAVTILFTGVSGCTTTAGTTIIVSPRTKLEYMKATNLCEYNGGVNGSVVLEVKYSGQHNFTSGSTTGHWKFSNAAISANPVNPAEPAALATSATEAKGTFQGVAGTSEVRYIDNTTGCTANEYLTTINIEAIPAPVVTSPLEVCQNAPAPILTVNEAGPFKWWSTGSVPDANAPIPSTATAGSTDYRVSKEKTYNAQPTGATGSATAAGYTCLSPQAIIRVTVNAGPVISFANNATTMKLCAGATYNDAISLSGAAGGTWAVYQSNTTNTGTISTGVTNSTTANRANIQAGNATAAAMEEVFFISNSNFSCKSNGLPITTYPKPVMNIPNPMTICGNMQVGTFIPPSAGVAEGIPNRFKWKPAPHATNTDLVGLADYDTDWSKESIDNFTSIISATLLKREVEVSARNSISECEADKQTYTIIVRPGLVATYSAYTPICTGTETGISLTSSLVNTTYSWAVNNNSVGALSQSTPSNAAVIKQTLTNTGSTSATVTYTVTAVAGTCSNTLNIPIEVSHLQGLRPAITGAGSYCTDTDTKIYQTNFTIAPQGADVEWVYTSHASESNSTVSGNTQKLTKGPLTEVKDNLILTGAAPIPVNYVFRPYNACFGFSSELGVTVYPPPEASTPVSSTMCSSSDLHPVTSNISLNLSTAEVVYTWTVDNAAPGATGYTQPSRNGAGVPQNPVAAKTGIIADPLSIIPSATAPQTIDYWITPWRSGCAGKAVKGSVVVNPLPVVSALPNRSHCTGAKVFDSALDGTNGAGEFIWEGGRSVGLPDQPAYASLLSGYTAANVSEQTSAQVKIWAKNSNNCLSPSPTILTIAVDPVPSLSFEPSRALCTGLTVATAAATNIKITPSVKGTRYTWRATVTDNKTGSRSDIRMVENDTEVALPFEIIAPAEGDLIRKLAATFGSDATVNFKLTPTLGACRGTATNIPVRVMGADLRGYISNNASVICSGSSTNIVVGQAGDGILYSWVGTGNGNIDGMSRQEAAVSATFIKDILTLKNGSGSVTYLIEPSRTDCVGAPLSILVAINPTPEIKVEPETAAICSGVKTAITLSVTNMNRPESNEVLYSWHTSDNQASNNNVGALPGLTPQADFVQQVLKNESPIDQVVAYTITPYYSPAGGIPCSGKPATSTYRVSSPATAMISNSTPEKICLGDVLTLEANIKGANCRWLKNDVAIEGATSDSYAVPADIVSVFSYSLKITNSCGSSTSGSRLINVTEDAWFAEGSAAINKPVANVGEVVGFTYTGPPADYQWDFNDDTFTPAAMTTFHHYFKPGIYYPKLKLLKPGNAVCNKMLALPSLEIKGIEYQITTGEIPVPEGFSVFPIPAHDQLTIISENELQNITLCDLQGRTLKNEAVSGRNVTMSIDRFSPGVYLLSLTDSKGVKRVKVGKE